MGHDVADQPAGRVEAGAARGAPELRGIQDGLENGRDVVGHVMGNVRCPEFASGHATFPPKTEWSAWVI